MATSPDAHRLSRFVKTQDGKTHHQKYSTALQELRAGQKRSCWICRNNSRYQIYDRDEAKRYIAHSVLGPRLLEISSVVAGQLEQAVPVRVLMGGAIDAKKLHQSITTFHLAAVDSGDETLAMVLERIATCMVENPYGEEGRSLWHPDMLRKWEQDCHDADQGEMEGNSSSRND